MVGVMLTIAIALPVVTVGSPLLQLGDLITSIYLFAIVRFFSIAELDTGSPFTALAAQTPHQQEWSKLMLSMLHDSISKAPSI